MYGTYKKIMNGVAFCEGVGVAVTLTIITIITFGNVLSRYVLPTSWSFTEELVVNLFVYTTLLGAALCARTEGGLVSMALLNNLLSDKGKHILNIIMCIIAIVFCIIMVQQGFIRVESVKAIDKTTDVLRMHEWKFWTCIPVCFTLMGLHFIEFMIDNIHGLKHGEEEAK